MKIAKYFLIIIISILSIVSYNCQKKILPKLNNKSEVLDIPKHYKANKKSENFHLTSKEDLLEVRDDKGEILLSYLKSDRDNSFSGYDYSINPLIGIYKQFHANNTIKTKGLYCWFGFKIGLWYEFDKDGNLLSSEDFDKDYKFTYHQIFQYCKKNEITLEKENFGNRTRIFKFFRKDLNLKVWSISYLNKMKNVRHVILLNGNNGLLIDQFEEALPN